MATSPLLNDTHSTSNHQGAPDETVLSSLSTVSTTPPTPTLPQQLLQQQNQEAHAPAPPRLSDASRMTPTNQLLDDRLAQTSETILEGTVGLEKDHQETNIKLKRCKHGRIRIKDLSKKRLAQLSDSEANSTIMDSKSESNNNHIASSNNTQSSSLDVESLPIETSHQGQDCSGEKLPEVIVFKAMGRSTPSPPIQDSCPAQSPTPGMADKSSKYELDNSSHSSKPKPNNLNENNHDTGRSSRRSCSRSRSRTPVRSRGKRKNSSRRLRRSRSPYSRDRSLSRGESRSFRRRHDSRSPKRRDRSPARRKKHRSPNPRRYRTPERHRKSDTHRRYRNSSASKSPSGPSSRSRSRTPPHRERHKNICSGPSKDKSKSESFDKLSNRRSPDDCAGPMDQTQKSNHPPTTQIIHQNNPCKAIPMTQTSLTKPTSTITVAPKCTTQQAAHLNFLPKVAQIETSTREVTSARSPTTPSNEDNASDIYDPEGPILPISPGDSPPISPMDDIFPPVKRSHRSTAADKNGDDNVPSSAVSLNQQSKYLEKANRQERVVEEVKIALRPFYMNRSIDKEQYKDVLRKAVPKICHSKNGEINPVKIQSLVGAYVRKMK